MVSLLDFMYHGQANVAEEDLERFMEVAEDLQVRGLVLSDDADAQKHGGGGGQERRVSGGEMDTAVDDDVNDLLAGLDDQPPPSKRVKQERHEAQQRELGFSITTSSGAEASAAVQERIRVKQEQRDPEARVASLPSSISMQKVSEPAPAPIDYTPPPGITLSRPGGGPVTSVNNTTHATPSTSDILASLNISSSVTSTPASRPSPTAASVQPQHMNQVRPQNIQPPAYPANVQMRPMQSPRPSAPRQPLASPGPRLQIASPGARQPMGPRQPLASPGLNGPRQPLASPGLNGPRQPLASPGPSGPRQPLVSPAMARVQVEQSKDGSPPVLHLPENLMASASSGVGFAGMPQQQQLQLQQQLQNHQQQQLQQQQMQQLAAAAQMGGNHHQQQQLQQHQQQLQQQQLQQLAAAAQMGANPEGMFHVVDNQRKKIIILKNYKKP